MPTISLTDFVDFSVLAGPPRVTKVQEIKHRGAYKPAHDYWKDLRDGIQGHHASGETDKSKLDSISSAAHAKKTARYVATLAAYKKFLGRKSIGWFEPPHPTWSHGGLSVRVNPELGLSINGEPHIIKLYFKDRVPRRFYFSTALAMMDEALGPKPPGKLAILDVGAGKLVLKEPSSPTSKAQLQAEASYFVHIWQAV